MCLPETTLLILATQTVNLICVLNSYMKNIIIPLTLVAILTVNYSLAQDNVKLSKEQMFKIYSEKLAELKLPTVDLNDVKALTFKFREETDLYERKIIEVGCQRARFDMDIDPYTGKIYACFNFSIGDITEYEKNIPLFTGNPEPFKKKEEIIKEAENCLKILNNGTMPNNIQFKEARYYEGGWRNRMHPFMGEWSVIWIQMEGPYVLGDIRMGINEKYGFSGFSDNRYSIYYSPKEIKITKEKAIEMANKDIAKIIPQGYKIEGQPSAELKIVNQNSLAREINPNYIKHPKSYARLAWEVKYNCVSVVILKDGSKLEPCKAAIWYDAETGEVLGAAR